MRSGGWKERLMEMGRGCDKNGAHKMSNNSKSCLLFYCSYYNIFLLSNVDYVTGSFIVFWGECALCHI